MKRVSRAAAVLARCFPDAEISGLRKLAEGWDNTIWEAGGFLYRVPKRKTVSDQARKEALLLEFLAGHGLPVPRPARVHSGDAGFGRVVIGYRKIPGTSLSELAPDEHPQSIYRDLGLFLGRLHSLGAEGAASAGLPVFTPDKWRDRYRRLSGRVRKEVLPIVPAAAPWLKARFDDFLNDRGSFAFHPAIIHGDLAMEHVIVDGGSLSGVVDFADACVGDPALDFAGMSPRVAPLVLEHYRTACGQDRTLLSRAGFYRAISPCYALLYPDAAGTREIRRAVELLNEPA
jgi:aminoglycoside 2''-phosphotransferase